LVIVLVIFFMTLELSGVALVQFRLRPEGGAGSGVVSVGAAGTKSDFDLVLLAPPVHVDAAELAVVQRGLAAIDREAEGSPPGEAAGMDLARRLIAGFDRTLRDPAPLNAFLRDWLPRVLFLMIPVFALLLKIPFRHRRYFEQLIFSLHVHAFFFLATTLMIPLGLIAGAPWPGRLLAIVSTAYLLIAIRNFHAKNWFVTLFGFLLLMVSYAVVLATVLGGLLLIGVVRT
ncbi:MAG: hypothetical protein D6757_05990, partial [Alphaproteobacteria bacterium]